MTRIALRFLRLPHGSGLPLPARESAGAAGFDVAAGETIIAPGQRALVPTGLAVAVPEGYELQVRPRSGLAAKHGVTVLNAPGTIDCDYRGEIVVVLINHGQQAFRVSRGDRIAQLVAAPVVQAEALEVTRLDDTARGSGGFGSSGLH